MSSLPQAGRWERVTDRRRESGIRKARGCVAERMTLTYSPKGSSKRRRDMCPDVKGQKFCRKSPTTSADGPNVVLEKEPTPVGSVVSSIYIPVYTLLFLRNGEVAGIGGRRSGNRCVGIPEPTGSPGSATTVTKPVDYVANGSN